MTGLPTNAINHSTVADQSRRKFIRLDIETRPKPIDVWCRDEDPELDSWAWRTRPVSSADTDQDIRRPVCSAVETTKSSRDSHSVTCFSIIASTRSLNIPGYLDTYTVQELTSSLLARTMPLSLAGLKCKFLSTSARTE